MLEETQVLVQVLDSHKEGKTFGVGKRKQGKGVVSHTSVHLYTKDRENITSSLLNLC